MSTRRPARRRLPEAKEYRPQLATLVKEPPEGDVWFHEVKFDGYRIGCRIDGRKVTLVSRNGKDWTPSFPEVVKAATVLGAREALLDGEVAIVQSDGRTSFHALQNALGGGSRAGLTYFVFDVLFLDGADLCGLPLEERKSELAALVQKPDTPSCIRMADHIVGGGDAVYREACRMGLEGIVSKRRDLPYRSGRNTDWVKVKCTASQELVIGGFTEREDAAGSVGALLVGTHDAEGRLVFAGKVGTGFTVAEAQRLRKKLERLRQPESPFASGPTGALARHASWVRPELVAEVSFFEWTPDGKVRHASYKGLREDKPPAEIVPEAPRAARSVKKDPPPKKAAAGRASSQEPRLEIEGIRISHPDRILYRDPTITKMDLVRYYQSVADWILPHLVGRPLTLVHCPEGEHNECRFLKHSKLWASFPALRRVRIKEQKKIGEYLIAESVAGVIALAQMNVLEIHTWNSKYEHVEEPDRIVFDIDPGPQVPSGQVIEAARLIRSVLQEIGFECFVKTTGGAGLHVVVPLAPKASWTQCLEFSRSIAESIVQRDPALYTTRFPKAGRERKMLIDYLRNNRTNTSIAAFSTRARPHAPVSVPLSWHELNAQRLKNQFTVRSLPQRLRRLKTDPWSAYWTVKQQLK